MTKRMIDADTGEIIEVSSYRTPEQDKAYREIKKKETAKNRADNPFIFTEMNIGGLEVLNNKDLGYYLILQTYIDYKNMIKSTTDSNLPMTREQMQEVLKISSNKTLVNLVKRFKKQGLLYEEKVGLYGKQHKAFFIADKYCFRKGISGDSRKRKTDKAVKVFMSSLQEVYAQGDFKPADIGFIYKVIPFVHYDSNYLVKNPNERDYSKAEYLTIDDLAQVQGLSRQKTAQKLTNLVYDNKYVFARTKVGNIKELRVKANPFVVYRKAGEPKALGFEFYVNPE
ncbi:hypothetical protein [Virgibacillus salexigens]|uniref:Uncharacterized protein n=1 Tax=Virgibacillus massiliensis TaxID=1462526 RepID=A0A024Q9P1_9BACI|nr:hypothetical protein [Virgibacillus massiliensis]CDQ38920.1 hypothetical protein BN990_01197 [Virgibacillus massiliensis]